MIPGDMVIEKVHGLQCTGITLSERFAIMAAEHLARLMRFRHRGSFSNNQSQNIHFRRSNPPSTMTLRMAQQAEQQHVKQRLGIPVLRRFGSDGNLPGLQRSNSFGSFSQFRNRIPWRQSNGNMSRARSHSRDGSVSRAGSLSRAGSESNLSQASWHGYGGFVRRGRMGPLRGKMRGQGRLQQNKLPVGALRQRPQGAPTQQSRGGVRGRGRGRGGAGANRNQQNWPQQGKKVPTKEELDKQLDEYMATSQFILDKEIEDYMLKGTLMELDDVQ